MFFVLVVFIHNADLFMVFRRYQNAIDRHFSDRSDEILVPPVAIALNKKISV